MFERQWARAMVNEAAADLRADYARREKGAVCDMLLPFLLDSEAPGTSYRELAASQGVSEASLRMEASRMRKRYGQILREKVAAIVDSPDDV